MNTEEAPGQPRREIVVIGASAGGVEALATIAEDLPEDFAAAIFVLLHLPEGGTSHLADILDRAGPLPAFVAVDGAAIEPATISVAPPDHHRRDHPALPRRRAPRRHGRVHRRDAPPRDVEPARAGPSRARDGLRGDPIDRRGARDDERGAAVDERGARDDERGAAVDEPGAVDREYGAGGTDRPAESIQLLLRVGPREHARRGHRPRRGSVDRDLELTRGGDVWPQRRRG